MGCNERQKEIRRRRHRRKKLVVLQRRAAKASNSEKAVIAEKLRSLTPGCEILIARMGLEDQ